MLATPHHRRSSSQPSQAPAATRTSPPGARAETKPHRNPARGCCLLLEQRPPTRSSPARARGVADQLRRRGDFERPCARADQLRRCRHRPTARCVAHHLDRLGAHLEKEELSMKFVQHEIRKLPRSEIKKTLNQDRFRWMIFKQPAPLV